VLVISVYQSSVDAVRDVQNPRSRPTDVPFVFDQLPTQLTLGDTTAEYSLLDSTAGSRDRLIAVSWARGPLSFLLEYTPYSGAQDVAIAEQLAAQLDARYATLPPLTLPSHLIAAPIDEKTKLASLLKMERVRLPPATLPSGFSPSSQSAIDAAASVFRASDAQGALMRADITDGLYATLLAGYRRADPTNGNTLAELTVSLSKVGSANAAAADLCTFTHSASVSLVPFAAPVMGDQSCAFHTSGTTSNGAAFDEYAIAWRHGGDLLAVSLVEYGGSAPGSTVRDAAVALDAAYKVAGGF
jgi:hypothetical protein